MNSSWQMSNSKRKIGALGGMEHNAVKELSS